MKNVFLILSVLVLALVGCEKDPLDNKFKIDPYTTVDIKPDPAGWGGLRSTNPEHLTPLEIVEQTTAMQYYNPDIVEWEDGFWMRGFSDEQRDLNPENPMLKMWAADIISDEGEYIPHFIESENIVLVIFDDTQPNTPRDTIAYIPNVVVRAAETAIKIAYADNDEEEVYRLFHEAFTFRPVTGAEYAVLMANGEQ